MSQEFKLKFDEYKDNNPADRDGNDSPDYYPTPGNGRNLAFIWPDGRLHSFSYNYIITVSYDSEGEFIKIEFTSAIVQIKGINLVNLFMEIFTQRRMYIRVEDKRYIGTADREAIVVAEIIIVEK